MSYKVKDIMFEQGKHWVLKVSDGYEVYKIGITHSTRVAGIYFQGQIGLDKSIAEVKRREAVE